MSSFSTFSMSMSTFSPLPRTDLDLLNQALGNAEKALDACPEYIKGYYRLVSALSEPSHPT